MSKEQVFSHVQIQTRFTSVLDTLVEAEGLGLYLMDGLFLTNTAAGISGKPDGTFLSHESIDRGRAQLRRGKREGFVEVEGIPDMVLEVVSDNAVEKDTVELRRAYWQAGIPEYWLADGRRDPVPFDILRSTARGYVATRKRDGWIHSQVFDRAFRLTVAEGLHGFPKFSVEVR